MCDPCGTNIKWKRKKHTQAQQSHRIHFGILKSQLNKNGFRRKEDSTTDGDEETEGVDFGG